MPKSEDYHHHYDDHSIDQDGTGDVALLHGALTPDSSSSKLLFLKAKFLTFFIVSLLLLPLFFYAPITRLPSSSSALNP